MMDVLRFSLTLVCQGSFKQYRKIVVEALAHWERSTPSERLVYMQCFTGNYSGGHFGGRAMDEIREFDNKAVKECLRRTHRSEGDIAPELELSEVEQDVQRVFSSAFSVLNPTTGGSIPDLPSVDVVLPIAGRVQWPKLTSSVAPNVAQKQTPFFGCAHCEGNSSLSSSLPPIQLRIVFISHSTCSAFSVLLPRLEGHCPLQVIFSAEVQCPLSLSFAFLAPPYPVVRWQPSVPAEAQC